MDGFTFLGVWYLEDGPRNTKQVVVRYTGGLKIQPVSRCMKKKNNSPQKWNHQNKHIEVSENRGTPKTHPK